MYHHILPHREPSSPISIQRLPSFRNFELPRLTFPNFASSRTLHRAYESSERDLDAEKQELEPLTPHIETALKWETEYNDAAAEDPNLVSTHSPFKLNHISLDDLIEKR
jgi:2'-5' RNA ligase